MRCRRHEEDLGGNLLGLELAVLDFRRILPETCRFNLLEIADNQPLQRGQSAALHAAVGLRHRRVLAKDKVAFHLLAQHGQQGLIRRVRTGQARHEVKTPVIFLGCGVAPVGLHERDRVVLTQLPETLLVFLPEGIQVIFPGLLIRVRHGQVARQRVKEGRNIGRSLNRGVPAQSHDPRARSSHVAHEQLQDRRGTDELCAQGVLCKAQRVGEARGALRGGVLRNRVRQVVEVLRRNATGLFHHLRGVARVVALENLEDRIRILQRHVLLHVPRGALRLSHVLPRVRDVLAFLRVVPGEQALQILGVLEIRRDDRRRVRVIHHVIVEIQVIIQHVLDNRAEQHHVRASANADVAVRKGRRTCVARIHVDNARTTLLGFHDPLESHGVAFRHIRTLDDDAVRIRHILQRLGCAAAAKRRS